MQRIKFLFAQFIATGFYSGLAPKAPGTFGSVIGLAMIWFIESLALSHTILGLFWIIFGFLSWWAVYHYEEWLGTSDNPSVVADEILGIAVAAATWNAHGSTITHLILAFVVFRFFDIFKLPPVRSIDRQSKILKGWTKAAFVIFDDLIAALQALLVIETAYFVGFL
jgi:phosphatidylglycerophosphatase A